MRGHQRRQTRRVDLRDLRQVDDQLPLACGELLGDGIPEERVVGALAEHHAPDDVDNRDVPDDALANLHRTRL